MQSTDIRQLLEQTRSIAVIGISDNPIRASYGVTQYLLRAGYTIYPVNPLLKEVFGLKVYPDLAALPEAVDLVDVFRRPEFLSGIVEDAIAAQAKAIWLQFDTVHEAAAQRAEAAGLKVVRDLCLKIEHARLQIAPKA